MFAERNLTNIWLIIKSINPQFVVGFSYVLKNFIFFYAFLICLHILLAVSYFSIKISFQVKINIK